MKKQRKTTNEVIEKDLKKSINLHKYSIIASSLILYGDASIYDSPLLKDYKDVTGTDEERAFQIADDLKNRSKHGEPLLYDRVYRMCWRYVRNDLD